MHQEAGPRTQRHEHVQDCPGTRHAHTDIHTHTQSSWHSWPGILNACPLASFTHVSLGIGCLAAASSQICTWKGYTRGTQRTDKLHTAQTRYCFSYTVYRLMLAHTCVCPSHAAHGNANQLRNARSCSRTCRHTGRVTGPAGRLRRVGAGQRPRRGWGTHNAAPR